MKKRKDKRKEKNDEPQVQRPRIERVAVWTMVNSKNLESSLDIEWPEYNSEIQRIKENTRKYADVPLSEALCGIKSEELNFEVPEIPVVPVVGNFYKAKLTKKGDYISITGLALKEAVVCRNNLKRFTNMRAENREIEVKVVAHDKARQTVTIDVLQPVFEKWISEIVNDKTVQFNTKEPKVITVQDLKLCNGGFTGKAEVPVMSEFVGEPYLVDAFIPGSQIVLNIENDFSRWNGKSVETFVVGYSTRPNSANQMSLICSRKAVLNFAGNMSKIDLYNDYCLNGGKWDTITKTNFVGIVTGVINSSNKCGVFVEIPLFNITGMINTKPEQLVEFKNGEQVQVNITDFEQMLEHDPFTGSVTHLQPYVIENGRLKSCILKPVLKLAEKS